MDGHENNPILNNIVSYMICALAGTIGGCSAALMSSLKNEKTGSVLFVNLFSYAINGLFVSSLGMALMMLVSPGLLNSLERILIFGLGLGFIGSSALLGSQLVLKIVLKSLGVEIVWTVKRVDNIELKESSKKDKE